MIKSEQELRTFLHKRPNKSLVNIEIQSLNKEIERLNSVSSEYGKDNSRISNSYKKRNNCWIPQEQWDTKDRVKLHNNQDKKAKIAKQIEDLKAILKELKDYNYIEPVQMRFDFDALNETINKALS